MKGFAFSGAGAVVGIVISKVMQLNSDYTMYVSLASAFIFVLIADRWQNKARESK